MRILIILTVLLATSGSALAQVTGYGLSTNTRRSTSPKELKEYRLKKTSGKLFLELNNVVVEGYDGQEVIITRLVEPKEVDERATGLQSINASGLQDNTSIGLHIAENGGLTEVRLINTRNQDSTHVKIPKNLSLSIQDGKSVWQGDISIKNIHGEIEVSNNLGDVKLENVTGPLTVKTTHGNIEGIFKAPVKGPVSIVSTLGFVDVALPVSTKANIELGTTLGELFASDEFNITLQEKSKQVNDVFSGLEISTKPLNEKVITSLKSTGVTMYADEIRIDTLKGEKNHLTYTLKGSPKTIYEGSSFRTNNSVVGTINGGGESIILRTIHGKIYLRTTEKR